MGVEIRVLLASGDSLGDWYGVEVVGLCVCCVLSASECLKCCSCRGRKRTGQLSPIRPSWVLAPTLSAEHFLGAIITTFKLSLTAHHEHVMESSRIFVRGLPPKFTEDDVRKHFSKFPVTDVKFFPHRRIGYVGYKSPEDAAKAVKYFNKTFINLTKIHAEIARPVCILCRHLRR